MFQLSCPPRSRRYPLPLSYRSPEYMHARLCTTRHIAPSRIGRTFSLFFVFVYIIDEQAALGLLLGVVGNTFLRHFRDTRLFMSTYTTITSTAVKCLFLFLSPPFYSLFSYLVVCSVLVDMWNDCYGWMADFWLRRYDGAAFFSSIIALFAVCLFA